MSDLVAPFYILALDEAELTGWAVLRAPDGAVLDSGTANGGITGFADRARVVARFLELAGDAKTRVVFEDHSKIPASKARGTPQLIGMGKARGRWEDRIACVGMPAAHFSHQVSPAVWRSEVLGLHRRASEEQCKATAVMWAKAKLGRVVGPDEAEAVCIGAWAVRNIKVPAGRRRAA